MKTYRIAAIGFAHSHMRANLEAFASCGEKEWNLWLRRMCLLRIPSLSVEPDTGRCELDRAVEQYGFRKYEDYRQLLEENEIDIALVCCENAYHPVVMETILRRGSTLWWKNLWRLRCRGPCGLPAPPEKAERRFLPIGRWPGVLPSGRRRSCATQGRSAGFFKFTFRNSDSLGPPFLRPADYGAGKGQGMVAPGRRGRRRVVGLLLLWSVYGALVSEF